MITLISHRITIIRIQQRYFSFSTRSSSLTLLRSVSVSLFSASMGFVAQNSSPYALAQCNVILEWSALVKPPSTHHQFHVKLHFNRQVVGGGGIQIRTPTSLIQFDLLQFFLLQVIDNINNN